MTHEPPYVPDHVRRLRGARRLAVRRRVRRADARSAASRAPLRRAGECSTHHHPLCERRQSRGAPRGAHTSQAPPRRTPRLDHAPTLRERQLGVGYAVRKSLRRTPSARRLLSNARITFTSVARRGSPTSRRGFVWPRTPRRRAPGAGVCARRHRAQRFNDLLPRRRRIARAWVRMRSCARTAPGVSRRQRGVVPGVITTSAKPPSARVRTGRARADVRG